MENSFSTPIYSDMGDKHWLEVNPFTNSDNSGVAYHCTIDNEKTLDIVYVDVDKWEDVMEGETPLSLKIGAIIEAFAE